jgi:hypothetical protein
MSFRVEGVEAILRGSNWNCERGWGVLSLIRLYTAVVLSVENCFELSNEF